MFGLLKNKISSFIGSLTKKEEEKPAQPPVGEEKPAEEKKQAVEEAAPQFVEEKKQIAEEKPVSKEIIPQSVWEKKPVLPRPQAVEDDAIGQKPFEPMPKPKLIPAMESKPREEIALKPKLGLFSKVRQLFSSEVEITEGETKELFEQLEMALLESDVSFDTAQFVLGDLRKRLVGKRVQKGKIDSQIRAEFSNTLNSLFAESFSLVNYVSALKNKGEIAVIVFLGPNGAGKTTTIAKLAKFLQENNFTPVISASDTFRAAAIEQSAFHGEKLGVKVVKHSYGSDPAAVAFDAINYAKAHAADVVLVDTAGRQETNQNLLKEMEKIVRVVKPHLKIFVGETIAGNSIIEQAKTFNEKIKLDAIILTKLDCDAKGGNAFSIAYETKLPLLFIGVGQEYADLIAFDSNYLVGKVLEKETAG
ncbi:signal recognition particle-docking protein FtsY [Candidatus Micrarchaeota archaeon]|nr:signal recognition particle-docking protein FtsY [Candidatus Micrarchaeota archaeon]